MIAFRRRRPDNTSHEWCPPGHGDLYPAMLGSGCLDMLLEKVITRGDEG